MQFWRYAMVLMQYYENLCAMLHVWWEIEMKGFNDMACYGMLCYAMGFEQKHLRILMNFKHFEVKKTHKIYH